jgi:putative membrane protein
MHFLKTLFWVSLTIVAVIFSIRNWEPVAISLWAGMIADVKLPVLMILGILIGFAPTYAIHRARLWRLQRRIDTLERNALLAGTPIPAPEPVDPPEGSPA